MRVRTSPDTSSTANVIGSLSTGDLGTVQSGPYSGSGFTWYYVQWDKFSQAGYTAQDYIASVVTAPAAPVTNFPSSGTVLTTLTPTMTWNSSTGATNYGLYVKDTATGTLVYNNDSVGNTTSLSLPSGVLAWGRSYTWNMRASNSAGYNYSPSVAFSTQSQVTSPAAPVTIYPSSGTSLTTLTPTMTWNASNGATDYGLYVKDTATGTLVYDNDSIGNRTSFTLPSGTLASGRNYTWNMRASNSAGYNYSPSVAFSTQSPLVAPAAPVTIYPASGNQLTTLTPTMTWNASTGATDYGLYVKDTATGTLVYNNDSIGNRTSLTLPAGILAAGRSYTWNMRASNSAGYNYSPSVAFSTQSTTVTRLPAPTITAPPNGATNQSVSPTFTWSQVSGNQGYRIILSSNASDLPTNPESSGTTAGGVLVNKPLAQNANTYTYPNTLAANTTYYWEVHALGSSLANAGYWTSGSFTTAGVTQPPYAVSPQTTSVNESAGSITFTITRTGSTAAAETIYATTAQTELSTNNADYWGDTGKAVTFLAGSPTATYKLYLRNDTIAESPETFAVLFQRHQYTDDVNTYLAKAKFTILDDDGGSTTVGTPMGVSASDNTFTDRVRVTWNAVSGTGLVYDVYRSENMTIPASPLKSDLTALQYDDLTAVAGKTYNYWVRARIGSIAGGFGGPDTGTRAVSGWAVADGWDYPIGDRGYSGVTARPIQEFPVGTFPERNTLFSGNPVANPNRDDTAINGAWYNAQDVGAYYDVAGGLHPGEDWNSRASNGAANDTGAAVYATANGRVVNIIKTNSKDFFGGGWTVIIEHITSTGDHYYSIYTHVTYDNNNAAGKLVNDATLFRYQVGQNVARGQIIARIADKTGSFDHLHFEIRKKVRDLSVPSLDLWKFSNGKGYYTDQVGLVRTTGMTASQVAAALIIMRDQEGLVDPSDFIDDNRPTI